MVRRLALAGSVWAATALVVPAASAQSLLDRPLWQFMEPGETASPATPAPWLHLAKSYGPTGTPNGSGAAAADGDLSESETGSLGCIVGGAVGTVAAAVIGGPNIVNLIAGGIVPAASPGAFYAALAGVVFASFCAVGQAMTPAILLAYRRASTALYGDPPELAPLPEGAPADNPPALLGRLIKISYAP